MNKPQIGMVIPIIQKRYILGLIENIYEKTGKDSVVLCVVNDGKSKLKSYLENNLPVQVELVHLNKNKCFAGANNAGWVHLIKKYPSIKYLGTINDDTIPKNNWLEALYSVLDKNDDVGACSPVMLAGSYQKSPLQLHAATWRLSASSTPMILDCAMIDEDKFVSVIGGFCFLAKKEALLQVGMFDDQYKNSCEDIDLSLKLRTAGWHLKVCHKSVVFHIAGKSRFKILSNTNIKMSRELLRLKWGGDLTKYNLK